MDDQMTQTIETQAGEPRSIAQALEGLLENAAEALNRAMERNDADWQKFHLGTAAAYKEWARQLEPLVSLQARIDEKAAMIRRRFQLESRSRPDARTHTPDDRELQDVVTAPDLSPPPGSGDYDEGDIEVYKTHVDAMFDVKQNARVV